MIIKMKLFFNSSRCATSSLNLLREARILKKFTKIVRHSLTGIPNPCPTFTVRCIPQKIHQVSRLVEVPTLAST